eukprot:15356675-Ditylum_brightwellii.AAC.1
MSKFHGWLVQLDKEESVIMDSMKPKHHYIQKVRAVLKNALKGGVAVAKLEKLVAIEFTNNSDAADYDNTTKEESTPSIPNEIEVQEKQADVD